MESSQGASSNKWQFNLMIQLFLSVFLYLIAYTLIKHTECNCTFCKVFAPVGFHIVK